MGFVGFTPDPLGFEQVEEALGDRVIITVSSSAHAGFQIAALQKRLSLMAGKLQPLIRMNDDPGFGFASPESHQQGIQYEVSLHA